VAIAALAAIALCVGFVSFKTDAKVPTKLRSLSE